EAGGDVDLGQIGGHVGSLAHACPLSGLGGVKGWGRRGERASGACAGLENSAPMAAPASEVHLSALASRRSKRDRYGDVALSGLSGLTSLLALALIGLIIYKVVEGAWPAIQEFGFSFIYDQTW